MDYLKKITERVNRNGKFYAEGTPVPLLTLDEFFEGNEIIGSIGCNLDGEPHPSKIRVVLSKLEKNPNVSQVFIQITEMDDPDWPFSDTVWVVTKASEKEVSNFFPDNLAPNEIWTGFRESQNYEKIEIPNGFEVLGCWWD